MSPTGPLEPEKGLAQQLAAIQAQANQWAQQQEKMMQESFSQTLVAPSTSIPSVLSGQGVYTNTYTESKEPEPAPEQIDFQIHQSIARNEKERRLLMWVNAKLLSHLEKTGSYKTILGDPAGKWVQYLAQIEVFYPRSTVYKMVRIYRKLSEELEISESNYDDIPINRLFDVVGFITKADAEDWFTKARVLTTRDWNIELRLKKGLVTEEQEHEHIDEEFSICTVCGRKERVHNEEEEGHEHLQEEEAPGSTV